MVLPISLLLHRSPLPISSPSLSRQSQLLRQRALRKCPFLRKIIFSSSAHIHHRSALTDTGVSFECSHYFLFLLGYILLPSDLHLLFISLPHLSSLFFDRNHQLSSILHIVTSILCSSPFCRFIPRAPLSAVISYIKKTTNYHSWLFRINVFVPYSTSHANPATMPIYSSSPLQAQM